MKNQILLFAMCIIAIQFTSAQITNTFPLNDSVGIGTTSPTELLQVNGNIRLALSMIAGSPVGGDAVFGASSLTSNITGTYNTAFGNSVLHSNLSGSSNCGFGTQALNLNISGNYNVAFGMNSLEENKSGSWNTAIGSSAHFGNQSGNYNVAIGINSLRESFKGSYNTVSGAYAMYYNKKGSYNVAMGFNAMDFNTTGNNNTAIGNEADVTVASLTNASCFGNAALVDASNKVRIGNASVTSIGGQVGWTIFSDARIKNTIQQNVPGLEFINLLNPVTYHYNIHTQNQLMGVNAAAQEELEGQYDIEKIQFTGFIAQEVDAAAQKINYDFSGVDKTGTLMGLRYSEFVVPLVKAVQELSAENEILQNENVEIKNTNDLQQKQIDALQKDITALKKKKEISTYPSEQASTNDGAVKFSAESISNNAPLLGQNIPNPFDQSTLIPFRIPKNCTDASIIISDIASGRVITVIPLSCSETHLTIDAGNLVSGIYTYSLYVNSVLIDTKQMVIAK